MSLPNARLLPPRSMCSTLECSAAQHSTAQHVLYTYFTHASRDDPAMELNAEGR